MRSGYSDQPGPTEVWQPPPDFVNPVPEPGHAPRRLPRPPQGWLDSTRRTGGAAIGVIFIVFVVFGSQIAKIYDDLKPDPAPRTAADRFPPPPPSGQISLSDGALTALFTPASGDGVTTVDHDSDLFKSVRWTLVNGTGAIVVTDYRFESSPVKSRDELAAYYSASGGDFMNTVGAPVAPPESVRRDGRKGKIWRGASPNGSKFVLAEFPGNPQSVRIACRADQSSPSVATQCDEIIESLQFSG